MAMTVTATQGGSVANGFALRVFVLTGWTGIGSSVNTAIASSTTWTLSITTTAGSNVYGASSRPSGAGAATGSNATIVDDILDSTNAERYTTFKALNVTGGATARGHTVASANGGPLALLEILGTITEDASSPAVANTTGAGPVTTASFTPPAGSLLVAIVSSDGGAAQTTFTVTDTGGPGGWVERVKNNPSGGDYAGVWTAQVAGGVTVTPQRYGQPAPLPVPQQRRYVSDPSFYPATVLPASPLDTAWQAGGGYWHLYADDGLVSRRVFFTQPPRVSDPSLLAPPAVFDPLLAGSQDTSRRYGAPAYYDRRQVPQQKDRRDANTLGTPAPVIDPTTSAAEDRKRRTAVPATHADRREVPQQRAYPDRQPDGAYTTGPSYLTGAWWSEDAQGYNLQPPRLAGPFSAAAAQTDPTTAAADDTRRRYTLPATHAGRRQVPQQRAYPARQPDGADTAGTGLAQAWWSEDAQGWALQRQYFPVPPSVADVQVGSGVTEQWWGQDPGPFWVAQRRYVSDPAFTPADTAAAGTGTVQAWWSDDTQGWNLQRAYYGPPALGPAADPLQSGWPVLWLAYNRAATHADRREVPQQRPYISDPSFYPTVAPADPLALAWGAGGGYWHLYNRAADAVLRWWMPQQRAYPDRLADGSYTAGPGTVQAWWSSDDQGWTLQRPLVSDPAVLAAALLEGTLLGGADMSRRVLAAAYWDRRLAPQQRAALQLLTPPVPLDPVLAAWADLGRRYALPATHYDRRLYPQQRLYWPLPAPPPAFTIGTLTAADTPAAVLTAADSSGLGGGTLTAADTRTGGPG